MAHDTPGCSLTAVEEETLGKDTERAQPVRPAQTPEGHAVEKKVLEVERKRQRTEWPAALNVAESLSNSWGR